MLTLTNKKPARCVHCATLNHATVISSRVVPAPPMLTNINVYITSAAQKDGLVHCLFNVTSVFDHPGAKSTVGTCSRFMCALPPTSQPSNSGDAPPAGPCKHACMYVSYDLVSNARVWLSYRRTCANWSDKAATKH
jgi:hypothetical protein